MVSLVEICCSNASSGDCLQQGAGGRWLGERMCVRMIARLTSLTHIQFPPLKLLEQLSRICSFRLLGLISSVFAILDFKPQPQVPKAFGHGCIAAVALHPQVGAGCGTRPGRLPATTCTTMRHGHPWNALQRGTASWRS